MQQVYVVYGGSRGHDVQGRGRFGPGKVIGGREGCRGRGKKNKNKVVIDGIDVSDQTQIFTASEWKALGKNGVLLWVSQKYYRFKRYKGGHSHGI